MQANPLAKHLNIINEVNPLQFLVTGLLEFRQALLGLVRGGQGDPLWKLQKTKPQRHGDTEDAQGLRGRDKIIKYKSKR